MNTHFIAARPKLSRTLRLAAAALCVAPLLSPFSRAADKPTGAPAAATAASTPELPAVAAGWKVELLHGHPDIHHPSVVTCAPDGRIFMAEDPMDMGNDSNAPTDRILCFFPDGHRTVFAEGLHAVFGMQYIDGKLYVHNVPQFSVFTDDNGVGKDRREIIDCTNPHPAPGFNDHIPANIRLGMDGFLYMATGDKGIFGAESNVDHRKAEIHGGGVLRIRPDGTDMEAYSTGTRNHLDVAINAEDEIFTLDNTDDGQGWWTRFTHMVDGGFYGYPFDYRPQKDDAESLGRWNADPKKDHPWKPYTLWRVAETGGGSATGAVAYNEGELPEEFQGNCFMCEWGKGALERWVVARDGGTYKLVLRDEKFFKNPEKGTKEPLRPVGVTVLDDGTGLLVTDWNYNGWKSKQDAGRLFKLTYTGKLNSNPKPVRYVPAAQGQPFTATTAELVAGLSHPSKSVRLVAQRRAAERGAEAVGPVVALLNDAKAPPYAKWSAIWTLDRMGGNRQTPTAGRDAIIAVLKDANADLSVRMQAARQLGTRRAKEAVADLLPLASHADAAMRFRAATALGRIGDPAAVPVLLTQLNDKDLYARYAAFTALTRIGRANPAAWGPIVNGFSDSSPAVRAGVIYATRDVYDESLVRALSAYVADTRNGPENRNAAVAALAPLHKQFKPWDGKWWATQPAGGHYPQREVEWDGTAPIASALRHALEDTNSAVRLAAIEALQVAPDPAAAESLPQLFKQDGTVAVRKSILRALAAAKPDLAGGIVTDLLDNASANPELLEDAVRVAEKIGGPKMTATLTAVAGSDLSRDQLPLVIEAVGQMHDPKSVPTLAKRLHGPGAKLATGAAAALGAISGDEAVAALIGGLKDLRPEVRKASADGLALALVTAIPKGTDPKLPPKSSQASFSSTANAPAAVRDPEAAFTPLMDAAKNEDTQREAIAALCVIPDVRALDAYLDGLGNKDGTVREKCRRAVTAIHDEALPLIEQRLEANPLPTVVIDELQKLYSTNALILDWQVVGPFPNPTPEPFDVAKPPTGETLKGLDDKPAKWIKMRAETKQGRIDFVPLMNPHDNVTAYAVHVFNADAERVANFSMGADDGLILWLNGQKIFEDLNDHAWQPDSFSAKGKIQKGRNVLVAKIMQHGGPWEFSVGIGGQRKGKLFEYDTKNLAPEAYGRFAATHGGNAESGKKIFFNPNGVGCVKCHKVGNEGGDVGPSLSGVGVKYGRDFLVESILYPSKQILDGYQQTVVKTKAGRVEYGIVKEETDAKLTLVDSGGQRLVYNKADVASRKVSNVSLMPEGLHTAEPEEFCDLIAYLETLKEKPPEAKK